ncbi:hypothetical protein PENTCL1PPCAC_27302, partial [Pristionchus entomophagus]
SEMWLHILIFFLAVNTVSSAPNYLRADDAKCSECEFAVRVLHNWWGADTMDKCAEELIETVCEELQIVDNFICAGIASSFADEAMWVVGEILIEPEELCGLLLENCGNFVHPSTLMWNLTIVGGKPPVEAPKPIQKNGPTLKVLQLSDLHIDRKYEVGAEAKCGEPSCCRPFQDPDEVHNPNNERRKRDAPVQVPAGKWGTVADCDAPYWLYEDMLDHVAKAHKDLDYVVISGDYASHADWDYTRERHVELIRNIADSIRQRLPTTPVFFAVGNHEGVPCDSFPPHFTPDRFHMDWLYGTMADAWKGWVPEDQMEMVVYNGCFMRKLWPGLRLISLNNGYGDGMNFFLYVNQTDPDGTMSWFQNQLLDAEKAGDKVHIVAHIPGGKGDLEGWALNYHAVVNRFETTITAQFMGHTHSEQFNMYYEDPDNASTRPTQVTYESPSLTPYSDYFPAYRIYEIEGRFEGSQYRVIDWSDFYLNLTEANAVPQKETEWKTLYASVLEEYGMKDVSPSSWDELITRMITDDKLFGKYRKNFYRMEREDVCDWNCRRGLLCAARKSHDSDAICSDLPPAVNAVKSSSNKKMEAKSRVQSESQIVERARGVVKRRMSKNGRSEGICRT